jgi:AbrB family looped-hinge helix DNA binding protein
MGYDFLKQFVSFMACRSKRDQAKVLLDQVRNERHMRVTSKGQVTIPIEIRDQFGIQPSTEVRFVVRHGLVVLEKDTGRGSMNRPARGEVIVNRLRKIARQTKATMTTDELLALTRGE